MGLSFEMASLVSSMQGRVNSRLAMIQARYLYLTIRGQIDLRPPADPAERLRPLSGDGRVLCVPSETGPLDRCPRTARPRTTRPGDLRALAQVQQFGELVQPPLAVPPQCAGHVDGQPAGHGGA